MTGIQKTKDYGQFKVVRGNRRLITGHVANLTVSIMERNMLAINPIVVNEKMEIIDGQHRFEVAKNNNLELFYVVLDNASIDEVVKLNATNRPWKNTDYIDSYAARGYKEFIWFREMMNTYQISVTSLMITLMSDTHWSSQYIRNGKLSLSEEQKKIAEERADIYYTIRPFIHRGGLMPKAFVNAICLIQSEGQGKKLVEGIKRSGKIINPETDTKLAVKQLREYLK